MRHVFVETNWVVGYAAPAHYKIPEAVQLLSRATQGEFTLHLPAICISEARRPLQEKYQMRSNADRIRDFLRWAKRETIVSRSDEEATRKVLDKMESRIKLDLDGLDTVFDSLKMNSDVEIFDLNQEMLQLCTDLSFLELGLEPFDQAVLAAVLVKGSEILGSGDRDVAFCEPDSHLQPWTQAGPRKDALTKLYDDSGIWVYGDFLLENPEKPADWPQQK